MCVCVCVCVYVWVCVHSDGYTTALSLCVSAHTEQFSLNLSNVLLTNSNFIAPVVHPNLCVCVCMCVCVCVCVCV